MARNFALQSQLLPTGVSSLLNYYRNTYVRARAVGQISAPGSPEYESSFINISSRWTTVAASAAPNSSAQINLNPSEPLIWTDIPADVTIVAIEIYTASGTTPIAWYRLDESRSFSTTGTLQINTLPTILNSTNV